MKARMTICAAAAVCILAWTAQAGEQTWTFDNGADDWTPANGTWETDGGVYRQTKADEAAAHTLIGDADWTDYTLEAKVRIDEGNWTGLIVRAQDEFQYYVYYLNVPDNKSELWQHNAGGDFKTREAINSNNAAQNVAVERGVWLDVSVEAAGDVLTLWINGEKQAEHADDTYAAGMIGLWSWTTAVSFDDVKVSGDSISSPATSVDPKGKLAAQWGSLKRR